MIFEFFKRLFWKADEGNRKRKTNESLVYTEDDSLYPKKRCCDFVSSNHVKIIITPNNDDNNEYHQANCDHSSCSCLQLNDETNQSKKLEFPTSLSASQTNFKAQKFSPEADFGIKKCDSLGLHTIRETHKLNEKKQYNDMLINCIPSERKTIVKGLSECIKQEYIAKTVNMNNSKIESPGNVTDVTEMYKQKFSKPWCFLNTPVLPESPRIKKLESENKLFKEQSVVGTKSSNQCIPIQIIKTNTLRNRFSNKEVMKHDFIEQLTKKYNERLEQCNKEAEELKRMTYTLSKYNRMKREAALEDHLNRSMRLCEAVLNENDLLTDSKLPELDADMINRIKWALSAGSTDEVLVQEFGLRITRKDIQTLAGLNWLNDEVINFYMNLLIVRGNDKGYPSVYAMNTFFYPKLVSSGHASLKRWTRKVDIFAKDLIVIPIHLEFHWCMSIIDFRNKSICYYDSMGSSNYKCLQVLKQYLHDESIDKKKKSFDFVDWNFQCVKDIPQQMNGSDCGVFSCMFAEYVCANKSLNFSQEDMPYFRKKMIYEILAAKLL